MARLPRLNPPGVVQHIIQRSKKSPDLFLLWGGLLQLPEVVARILGEIWHGYHAYMLMTNHAHILATPRGEDSISKTMQSLG